MNQYDVMLLCSIALYPRPRLTHSTMVIYLYFVVFESMVHLDSKLASRVSILSPSAPLPLPRFRPVGVIAICPRDEAYSK